jgi:hypothetical protein
MITFKEEIEDRSPDSGTGNPKNGKLLFLYVWRWDSI